MVGLLKLPTAGKSRRVHSSLLLNRVSQKNVPREGIKKTTLFFLLSVKELRRHPPPPFLTTSIFSDKDFLDWTRPPPPFYEKKVVKIGQKFVKIGQK